MDLGRKNVILEFFKFVSKLICVNLGDKTDFTIIRLEGSHKNVTKVRFLTKNSIFVYVRFDFAFEYYFECYKRSSMDFKIVVENVE